MNKKFLAVPPLAVLTFAFSGSPAHSQSDSRLAFLHITVLDVKTGREHKANFGGGAWRQACVCSATLSASFNASSSTKRLTCIRTALSLVAVCVLPLSAQ